MRPGKFWMSGISWVSGTYFVGVQNFLVQPSCGDPAGCGETHIGLGGIPASFAYAIILDTGDSNESG